MPQQLTYEIVKEYIEKDGDILISKSYSNNQELLEIKCYKCNKIYKKDYRSLRAGYYHNKNYCVNGIEEKKEKIKNDDSTKKVCYGYLHREGKILDKSCFYDTKDKKDKLSSWCIECYRERDKSKGKDKNKTKDKICEQCKKEYKARIKQKFCSKQCADLSTKGSEKSKENGRKGGLISVTRQNRRSKGEIHFANLCIEHYGE
jgi:hypothetical protein